MLVQIKRLIPNLLTAGNLVGGIIAIILALSGKLELAPIWILISALFDFLDGFAARLLKVQSELGKQLDSLADMVTFGVAPGIITFVFFNHALQGHGFVGYNWMAYLALLIPVFSLFRLAKFNLDTRQTDQFIGLPTPAMTIFFATFPLLLNDAIDPFTEWKMHVIGFISHPVVLTILIIVMSSLMLVELPLFALKFKHFKWAGNEIRYIFLTISIGLLATLFVWALPLIILLYIVLSIINNLTKKSVKDEIQS